MKYINNTIRRQDRLLDEERAKEILRTAEYGVMSMVDDNDQDLRKAVAGPQEFAATAPVSLVLVSDHSRFPAEIPDAPKATMGAIDAGYVSQNIALVCTALGLNNVPRMTMDAASLKKALNLTDKQDLLLNQQIGYPK